MTKRLVEAVIKACQRLPTLHVAELFGLHWDSVHLLERRALQVALEKLPKAQPRRLVMEVFALFKGHRYASVVLDADTRRVLWIGEGRTRAAVRPFFEVLGPEGCARIEAVAMDMNTAFDLEVRQHCPRARVVYDLFHVVAKYGREVIDRVRIDAATCPVTNYVTAAERLHYQIALNLFRGHDDRGSNWITIIEPPNHHRTRCPSERVLRSRIQLMTDKPLSPIQNRFASPFSRCWA